MIQFPNAKIGDIYVNESCLSSKILILTGQQTNFYVLAFQLRDLAQVFVKEYFALVNGEVNEVSYRLNEVNEVSYSY